MPRKIRLPDLEISICGRLQEFREASGLSRVQFAQRSGTDSTMIANLEYFRCPLRYSVGKKICNSLRLNPDWLVRREGLPVWHGKLEGPFERSLHEGSLFSEAYLRHFPADDERRYREHLTWSENLKEWLNGLGITATFEAKPFEKFKAEEKKLRDRPVMKAIIEDRDRQIIRREFGLPFDGPLASAAAPLARKR